MRAGRTSYILGEQRAPHRSAMAITLITLALGHALVVVAARRRAADIAALLGFELTEQTRLATAVSEVVRNAFRYAGGGEVTFGIDRDSKPQFFVAQVTDTGPGIPDLDNILQGRYRSKSGMGLGLIGARRLVDDVKIETKVGEGTTVTLVKRLLPTAPVVTAERLREIQQAIAEREPETLAEEFQRQNGELLLALSSLQERQDELRRLNRELEDTNRGVVALYAELDDRADHLRRADEMKSRFLSNMSHEFRTPVNSIIGLCNLLLDERARAGVDPEAEIPFIRQSAEHLLELVSDLLDLAKVEAGKTVVRPVRFEIPQLFGALRGMLRPLLLNQSVSLIFEEPDHLALFTDEAKLSQILRNLVSNALKFTERGEVRVSARAADAGLVEFSVADTGIGIAAGDLERIFEEFFQLEHRLQRKHRGTGLGLPLSRRLAELLGGALRVHSEPGVGSTFTLTLPDHYSPAGVR